MKVMSLVGARPNFIKISPIIQALQAKERIQTVLIHSGQHYDPAMSEFFFRDLNIPEPDVNLDIGSGTHAEQTGKIMIAFEKVCLAEKPDLIIVVGDVNSTLAGALVAAKLQHPLAHVEAGLRSFDRTMPEEINRVLTDAVADLLFSTEEEASANLINEGIASKKIFFVGNVMIDSLFQLTKRPDIQKRLEPYDLKESQYALVTLHRPENVDQLPNLRNLLELMGQLQKKITVVFPMHPRTRKFLKDAGLMNELESYRKLRILEPVGYLDFVCLMKFAKFVLTDSGGIQEETTALGVPCITVRKNTERPVTVTQGTNIVAGLNPADILAYCEKALKGEWKASRLPPLWDGKAAERIVQIICEKYSAG